MTRASTPLDVIEGRARWCVVCGERDDVLASMGDAAVDVTITDPGYDEHTHANVMTTAGGQWKPGGAGRGVSVDLGFDPCDPATYAGEVVRVTKRWAVAFCALEQFAAWKSAVIAAGGRWVRAGVWDRIAPTPQLSGDRPAQAVDGVAIGHAAGPMRWNGGGDAAIWRHIRLAAAHGHVRTGHPNEKPLALMRELVRQFSDPGEVIADWHAGSGTTGVAALVEGRRVILVERDPVHAETCRRRCEETEPGVGSRRAKQLVLGGVR